MEIQAKVDGHITITQPSRHLVKEGKLFGISSSTGKATDKYVYLVSYQSYLTRCACHI